MRDDAGILWRRSLALCWAAGALFLTGCGVARNPIASSRGGGAAAVSLHGVVHGGQNPVSGARIYLYSPGGAYGGASQSLVTSGNGYTLTNADGEFNFGTFSCPEDPSSLLYVVAAGGDSGDGPNNKLMLMAAVGNCASFAANEATTFVAVNEVSTVAAVYALAPFMTGATSIGAPSSNLQGIANAFATVPQLVDLGTGEAYATTPNGNGAVPRQLIDTIANFLSLCVNSNGATGQTPASGCDMVFAATKVGDRVPTDTVAAVLAMAKNPGNMPGAVWSEQPSKPPFQPILPASPNDLTLAILYTGGGLQTPVAMAIDAAGNAWIADDNFGTVGATGTALTEIEAGSGVFRFGATGGTAFNLLNPQGMAFTGDGKLWLANYGSSTVPSYLTLISGASGPTPAATEPSGATFSFAQGITVDSADRAWIVDVNTGSLSVFDDTGAFIFQTVPGSNYPATYEATSIAADANGHVWATQPVCSASAGCGANPPCLQGSPVTTPTCAPMELDSNGTVIGLAAGYAGAASFLQVSPLDESVWDAGFEETSYGYWVTRGTGANRTYIPYQASNPDVNASAIAFDGAGTAWTIVGGSSVVGTSNSGSLVGGGYNFGLPETPPYYPGLYALAPDASGNLWVTVEQLGPSGYQGVLQVVGLATPVTTPIAASMGHALP